MQLSSKRTLREKCSNMKFFSGPYFPVFSPNTGKYGPERTPYLDTFHAVETSTSMIRNLNGNGSSYLEFSDVMCKSVI